MKPVMVDGTAEANRENGIRFIRELYEVNLFTSIDLSPPFLKNMEENKIPPVVAVLI